MLLDQFIKLLPKPLEPTPPEEPSHNASSITSRRCPEIQLKSDQNPTKLSKVSERERVSSQVFHLSRTSSINCEEFNTYR